MSDWNPFPHDASAFDYTPKNLASAWPRLHAGDQEPYPAGAFSRELVEGWCAFHRGDFQSAVAWANKAGDAGHVLANKTTGIYADYLEDDEKRRLDLYQEAVDRALAAIEREPGNPNAHYFHAFALGRYSQGISIGQALSQGLGGKIRRSLDNTLELCPDHAEAHTALGLYHAEIIDKVGRMVGRMTYGASTDSALEHFQRALELTPEAPIAHIEYGNGLYLLFGDKRLEDSNAAYLKASSIEPADAMQMLDVEYARASME